MNYKEINPYSVKETKELLFQKGISPYKGFGQNFLASKESALSIIDFADIKNDESIIEVGPGLFSLTFPILERAKFLCCVEIDRNLFNFQNSIEFPDNIQFINDDFLKMDLAPLVKRFGKLKIVSNLPFNISSQVLIKLLNESESVREATLAFQKELAQRILSKSGPRTYGTLSVLCALITDLEKGPILDADVFFPKPKVKTQLVKFKFKEKPDIEKAHLLGFESFLRDIFKYRRKKLLNTFKNALCLPTDEIKNFLTKQGVDENNRIEKLEPKEIYRIYKEALNGLKIPLKMRS